MTDQADTLDQAQLEWLQRWNKLQRIEMRECEQEMVKMLQELLGLINRIKRPDALRRMLAILEESLPAMEHLAERYSNAKKRKP